MRNRIELAQLFRRLGYQKGAEIGVFDGHYAEILCQTIPGLQLYAIDYWQVYRKYRDHAFQLSLDKALAKAHERLDLHNVVFMKQFSADAVKQFQDQSLDFVFIDGNHAYEYVKEDIEIWTPKVKKGGIVSGHDYYITKTNNVGVVQAVNEYADAHNIDLQFTGWDLGNPIGDDRQPCWYFTKE
jgi:predicted O-methyltransferase YrrM